MRTKKREKKIWFKQKIRPGINYEWNEKTI